MLTISAIILITVSSLIILDNQDVTEAATEIKEAITDDVVIDSFQDYYSVFNKKGGWTNLAFVILGVGLAAFVVSIFGYCQVHEKTVFLLFAFTILHLVILMLQIGAVMLQNTRHQELLQFHFFSNFGEPIKDFQYEIKKILLVLSVMWTVVSIIMCLVTIIIRFKTKRKENQLDVSVSVA